MRVQQSEYSDRGTSISHQYLKQRHRWFEGWRACFVIEASVLQTRHICNTIRFMKTLSVRLPEPLVADIEAESRGRKISKSDVVRERLELAPRLRRRRTASLRAIADLVGSVDGLPSDLAARKKAYLRSTGYGQKRPR